MSANPRLAHARQERARSNAAGTHADRRARRSRTRTAAHQAAVRDQQEHRS